MIQEIGVGAAGIVYLARDLRHEMDTAVKELVIPSNIRGSERKELIGRFQREAKITAALNHPNIVRVYNSGLDNNRHFIIMEYLPGKTLQDYIHSQYNFTYADLFLIFKQILEGLEYAHSHGIVHRDIKPENIKLLTNQTVKIMDFGIAHMEYSPDSLTQDGSVLGTISYISPEQLQDSKTVSPQTDIFSVGVILYELLTQTQPFAAETVGKTMLNIITQTPVPISKLNPSLPPALEKILGKCLKKDRRRRYKNAKELQDDLAAFQGTLSEKTLANPIFTQNIERQAGTELIKNSFKILHIEDDLLSQNIFASAIEKDKVPMNYLAVSSLAEAQSELENQGFDFIICDYLLPDGTTMDILEELCQVPTVMITSIVDPQTIIDIMKKGALDYIVKSNALNDIKKVLSIIYKQINSVTP